MSSILIEGMDIPKNKGLFYDCLISGSFDGNWEFFLNGKTYPISEVPTHHGRLIDADRLMVVLKNSIYASNFFRIPTLTISQIEQLIEHQPTIIDAEE